MTSNISYDYRALEARSRNAWRDIELEIQPIKPTWKTKAWTTFNYALIVAVVGVSVYYVTPAHARDVGVMNHEARQISPSVVLYGSATRQKFQADVARDNNKAENQMELENLKFDHQRQLLEDKAYYEKLKDQRKHK
jgi:hypothetical protein